MTKKKPCIGLAPFGGFSDTISKTMAAHIQGYLHLDVDILSSLPLPGYAYDKIRLQYNAGIILKRMESEAFRAYDKVVGVLDVDIFVPIVTHVFGEAKQGGRCALVSIYRLKRNPDGSVPPPPLLLERAAKVALHELGHLFDIHHCMDKSCLMHFSGVLEDLDRTPLDFCRYCSIFLRTALSAPNLNGGIHTGTP
jgi:archaemetzincin